LLPEALIKPQDQPAITSHVDIAPSVASNKSEVMKKWWKEHWKAHTRALNEREEPLKELQAERAALQEEREAVANLKLENMKLQMSLSASTHQCKHVVAERDNVKQELFHAKA
jgi:transposase-like protein